MRTQNCFKISETKIKASSMQRFRFPFITWGCKGCIKFQFTVDIRAYI